MATITTNRPHTHTLTHTHTHKHIHNMPEGPGLQTGRLVKPTLWTQPFHSPWLEYLWHI